VKVIVFNAYRVAKTLLQERFDLLDAFAKKLLEKETMDGPEIDLMIQEFETQKAAQV